MFTRSQHRTQISPTTLCAKGGVQPIHACEIVTYVCFIQSLTDQSYNTLAQWSHAAYPRVRMQHMCVLGICSPSTMQRMCTALHSQINPTTLWPSGRGHCPFTGQGISASCSGVGPSSRLSEPSGSSWRPPQNPSTGPPCKQLTFVFEFEHELFYLNGPAGSLCICL